MNPKWIIIAVILLVALISVVLMIVLIPRTDAFRKSFMEKCEKKSNVTMCQKLLTSFEEVYEGKSLCNFPEEDYAPVFVEAPFTHPPTKTMMWSETKGLVHDYTKKTGCFVTLEETLLGSVLDGETWCGLKGCKGTYTTFCNVCSNNTVAAFWRKASAMFAAYAQGEVTVMLNGDINNPYDPDGYFGSSEVPNLNPAQVTRLTVILTTKEKATCADASLKTLQKDLRQGIAYSCKEVKVETIETCTENNTPCGRCW